MHRLLWALSGALILGIMLACAGLTPASSPQAAVSTIVAETLAAVTRAAPPAADTQAAPAGTAASFSGGQLVIPNGLATGIGSETIAAVVGQQDAPWWELAPEHLRLTLQGYALQGEFHEPEIFVFPAADYAAVNESAASNIQVLQGVVANPSAVPDSKSLPNITFFNAGPVFQSQVAVLPFRGGYGVRAVTEYAQYAAPINNHELFYHFQGLTADGKKYLVAILPVTARVLQADSTQGSVPPAGGVAFPNMGSPDPAAYENYYSAVTNLLNGTSPRDFAPSLTALDALIGSLSLAP